MVTIVRLDFSPCAAARVSSAHTSANSLAFSSPPFNTPSFNTPCFTILSYLILSYRILSDLIFSTPPFNARALLHVEHRRHARSKSIFLPEKAARGAPPEDYERTDGELNWRQRVDLASELAAQKHRVGGKKATRGGPT